jgi:hypothetical protein
MGSDASKRRTQITPEVTEVTIPVWGLCDCPHAACEVSASVFVRATVVHIHCMYNQEGGAALLDTVRCDHAGHRSPRLHPVGLYHAHAKETSATGSRWEKQSRSSTGAHHTDTDKEAGRGGGVHPGPDMAGVCGTHLGPLTLHRINMLH